MDDREKYEARYLLDGRRVQISDLLAAGLLMAGQTLRWELKRKRVVHTAEVGSNGTLRLADGTTFRTPSRAAAVAAKVRAVDGWHAWTTESNETLDHLRRQLLAVQVDAQPDGTTEGGDRTHRFELLQEAREAAETGHPKRLTVRELMSWWNAAARGANVRSRVAADLANHGLETWPEFKKVALDTSVELRVMSDPEDAADIGETTVVEQPVASDHAGVRTVIEQTTGQAEDEDDDDDDDDGVDAGITVGNLPSALAGLVSVPATATFEQAITFMLINDYSQIAVLNGRDLRGAVTWRSIARARNADPNASFSAAIVEATAVDYDVSLAKCLQYIENDGFFFVRDATRRINGIVTSADVVNLYGQLASPFILIGELDRALRRVMSRKFTMEQIIHVADRDGGRGIKSYDDLTFGDYQQVLSNPELWAHLGWALDRKTFAERLDQLRGFRNDVMHFNPDPAPVATVTSLEHFISLIRSYCD